MTQTVSHGYFAAEAQVDPRQVHVGSVVDKVALGNVSLRELRFSPVSIIPSILI